MKIFVYANGTQIMEHRLYPLHMEHRLHPLHISLFVNSGVKNKVIQD